jgi:hypothetical protein
MGKQTGWAVANQFNDLCGESYEMGFPENVDIKAPGVIILPLEPFLLQQYFISKTERRYAYVFW